MSIFSRDSILRCGRGCPRTLNLHAFLPCWNWRCEAASGPCGLRITLLGCGMRSIRHPLTLSNLVPQLVSLLPTATEHLDFLIPEAPFGVPLPPLLSAPQLQAAFCQPPCALSIMTTCIRHSIRFIHCSGVPTPSFPYSFACGWTLGLLPARGW